MSPRASRSAPAQAIIAPLSVQSSGGGATSTVPRLDRDAHAARARIDWLAATPPAATSAVGAPNCARNSRKPGAQPVDNHVDHGLLERRAQIRDVLIG